jgi:signal transduction histidine kinase
MVADDALNHPADLVRLRHSMERLCGWLGQAVQEGRAVLHSLRDSTTQKNDLAEGLRQAAAEPFVPGSMQVVVAVIGSARDMHPIVRDDVYRIGYEAMRNSCLHSGGSRLEVDISYVHDLMLRVTDNGRGIEPEVAESGKAGHFGLQGMRERAARIGGSLIVGGAVPSGTEVRLTVPGRIIFRGMHQEPRSVAAILRNIFKPDQSSHFD